MGSSENKIPKNKSVIIRFPLKDSLFPGKFALSWFKGMEA